MAVILADADSTENKESDLITEDEKFSELSVALNDDGTPKKVVKITPSQWNLHFKASFVIATIGVLSLLAVLSLFVSMLTWDSIKENFFKGNSIVEILISYRILCEAVYPYFKYPYIISLGIIWIGGVYGFISLLCHLVDYKKPLLVPSTFYVVSFGVFSVSEIVLYVPMLIIFLLINDVCFENEKKIKVSNNTRR